MCMFLVNELNNELTISLNLVCRFYKTVFSQYVLEVSQIKMFNLFL